MHDLKNPLQNIFHKARTRLGVEIVLYKTSPDQLTDTSVLQNTNTDLMVFPALENDPHQPNSFPPFLLIYNTNTILFSSPF